MTHSPFSSIGPFKGVPSDVLARCALETNDAFNASVVALTRQAAVIDDVADIRLLVHPSLAAANSVWASVEADTASSTASAKEDIVAVRMPGAVLGGIGIALLITGSAVNITHNASAAMLGFAFCVSAIWATAFLYLILGRFAHVSLRQIREQGFLDTTLQDALWKAVNSGCLLIGGKALHVAVSQESHGQRSVVVKSVYWDAIGHATCELLGNGLEQVSIHGRDGTLVAKTTSPVGIDAGSNINASSLIEIVRERVASARKAA